VSVCYAWTPPFFVGTLPQSFRFSMRLPIGRFRIGRFSKERRNLFRFSFDPHALFGLPRPFFFWKVPRHGMPTLIARFHWYHFPCFDFFFASTPADHLVFDGWLHRVNFPYFAGSRHFCDETPTGLPGLNFPFRFFLTSSLDPAPGSCRTKNGLLVGSADGRSPSSRVTVDLGE